MEDNNNLQSMQPNELRKILREIIQEEFEIINQEIQRVIGEDDLVSTGTACRLLGVCAKVLKVLTDQGHFTIHPHLKERRYVRAELLAYRNKDRIPKRKY